MSKKPPSWAVAKDAARATVAKAARNVVRVEKPTDERFVRMTRLDADHLRSHIKDVIRRDEAVLAAYKRRRKPIGAPEAMHMAEMTQQILSFQAFLKDLREEFDK